MNVEEVNNDSEDDLPAESICVSLTVPKSDPPAGGYPVIVYGHGTGGSFRTAPTLLGSAATDPTVPVQFVLVGYDGHMHGDRSGKLGQSTQLDAGMLYYNFANPPAAKGNFFQGATDAFAMAKFAAFLPQVVSALTNDDAPGVDQLKLKLQINQERVAYHGHSQGGAAGPLIAPFSEWIGAVVISGTGGNLIEGLLGKKMPFDISTALAMAVQEISLDANHPGMHLLQTYFDEVDATPYAPLLGAPHNGGVHLLDIVGMSDTFTPPNAARIYAAATGASIVEPFHTEAVEGFEYVEDLSLDPSLETKQSALPLGANRVIDGELFTQAVTEHPTSSSYDGHFVVYQDPTAIQIFANFLASWVLNPAGFPVVSDSADLAGELGP